MLNPLPNTIFILSPASRQRKSEVDFGNSQGSFGNLGQGKFMDLIRLDSHLPRISWTSGCSCTTFRVFEVLISEPIHSSGLTILGLTINATPNSCTNPCAHFLGVGVFCLEWSVARIRRWSIMTPCLESHSASTEQECLPPLHLPLFNHRVLLAFFTYVFAEFLLWGTVLRFFGGEGNAEREYNFGPRNSPFELT
ncbi:hypothetical protein C8R45DRAFT_1005033 [Mycena sanguinolenta]|nr:hypothetical protein C8R45DRAFT_1005033 [Mycena sanguinolenta]